MKKLLMITAIACAFPLITQAVSKSDVARDIAQATNNLRLNAFDSNASQKVVTAWDNAFTNAKKFVIENCKDLLRKEDPDLMAAINKLTAINNDFTNTIKVTRGSMQTAPISRFLQISADTKKVMDQSDAKSFTLPAKKDAQMVVRDVSLSIIGSAKYFYDDLVRKK